VNCCAIYCRSWSRGAEPATGAAVYAWDWLLANRLEGLKGIGMKLKILVLSAFLLCSGAGLALEQEETFTDLTPGKDMLDPARLSELL